MTVRAWDQVRAFALGFPRAIEDFPWGESVVKIDHPARRDGSGLARGPMFLWLGQPDAPVPAVSVKLRASYDEAVALGGAAPMTYSGLGQWGWLTVPLAGADLQMVRDWIDESYRIVAPKMLIAELDGVGVGADTDTRRCVFGTDIGEEEERE